MQSPSASEGFLTVQRLSANVQGKCQKYNRIGPLTLVPFDKELTFKNIKDACKSHFGTNCECDVLAGERGPSYTHESQIKDWSKVIHIRFLEYEKSQKAEEPVSGHYIKVSQLAHESAIVRRQLSQNRL